MIRAAKPSDAATICDIWNPYIRDTLVTFTSIEKTTSDIADMILQNPCWFVAHEKSAVVGFATYTQLRKGPGYAHAMELTIYVAPKHQGKGFGRALVSALEETALAGDVTSLWAGCSSAAPQTIAFHKRLGFEQAATLQQVGRKFDQWMDLIFLRKPV